jgi:hypothetical protein
MRSVVVRTILRLLTFLGVSVLAIAWGCKGPDDSPLGRAQRAFGPKVIVEEADVSVPDATVFVAVPDPTPPDYDGFETVLVPTTGPPLHGSDAVRFAWAHGVRDAENLAKICGLFLAGSRYIGHEREREARYIQGREQIAAPAIDGTRLVFWSVQGAMAPSAQRTVIDLTTFQVVSTSPK